MGLVIDSNVFIDAENGRVKLNDLDFSDYDDAFIAAITVSELLWRALCAFSQAEGKSQRQCPRPANRGNLYRVWLFLIDQ